jgi:ornithine cyclodeaminase/alanine dehydrogenase-like protein (mu-crystallin family)
MTLILSNDDAAKVLGMGHVIERLESLYGDLGAGSAVYRGRTDLFAPTIADIGGQHPAAHQFKTLDGAIPRRGVASIRVTSDIVAFPIVNGKRRRIKAPVAEGNGYVGLVFLFSSATGELIAILQDGLLQRFTVGAINAIAARHMSRPNSKSVGLIGAGNQAGPQLEALKQVRDIETVKIYSPDTAEAEAFARRMAKELDVKTHVVASAHAAVEDVDIAVTATNSREPFFEADWLQAGMHLSCMQRDEPKDECFRRADVVFFHTRMKEHEYVSTDFKEMEKRYDFIMRDHPPREIDWNDYPDLGELVAGKTRRREREEDITFFLNSTGVGAQFTEIAHFIFERCVEMGLGDTIPTRWFNESIQP